MASCHRHSAFPAPWVGATPAPPTSTPQLSYTTEEEGNNYQTHSLGLSISPRIFRLLMVCVMESEGHITTFPASPGAICQQWPSWQVYSHTELPLYTHWSVYAQAQTEMGCRSLPILPAQSPLCFLAPCVIIFLNPFAFGVLCAVLVASPQKTGNGLGKNSRNYQRDGGEHTHPK